jgi:prolipoprotein diacylglyceryltransferase
MDFISNLLSFMFQSAVYSYSQKGEGEVSSIFILWGAATRIILA